MTSSGLNIPPMGGTEILLSGLKKYSDLNSFKNINLMLSNTNKDNIRYSKKNILWQHLNHNDESLSGYLDPVYMKTIDAFIYVSNWQYEKFRYAYDIPTEKSYIIKNAIDPIEYVQREKTSKIKLIYTSTPWRGLEPLLDIFDYINRDDIELDIYSSTQIYGSDFARHVGNRYNYLYERAKNTKGINYFSHVDNSIIREKLKESHIFVYPSIFEETSCLSMIEAGAAGCKLLSTNLGALYETGSEYANLVPYKNNKIEFIKLFSNQLNYEIDNYWTNKNRTLLMEQSDFYNKFYSWENRIPDWNNLFSKLNY